MLDRDAFIEAVSGTDTTLRTEAVMIAAKLVAGVESIPEDVREGLLAAIAAHKKDEYRLIPLSMLEHLIEQLDSLADNISLLFSAIADPEMGLQNERLRATAQEVLLQDIIAREGGRNAGES